MCNKLCFSDNILDDKKYVLMQNMTKVFLKCLFCFCSKSHEGNFSPNISYSELVSLWQLNRDPKKERQKRIYKNNINTPHNGHKYERLKKLVYNSIFLHNMFSRNSKGQM